MGGECRPAANETGLVGPIAKSCAGRPPSSHSAGQLTGAELGSRSRTGAAAGRDVGLGWWTLIATRGLLLCALTYTWDLQQHRAINEGVHSQACLELAEACSHLASSFLVNRRFSAHAKLEGLAAGTCSRNNQVSRLGPVLI